VSRSMVRKLKSFLPGMKRLRIVKSLHHTKIFRHKTNSKKFLLSF